MSIKYRKVVVKFICAEDLATLSAKIFPENAEKELLPNMRDVYISDEGMDFTYRRTVKRINPKTADWREHWKDLTHFEVPVDGNCAQINFHMAENYDNEYLADLFGQTFTPKTKSIFFPEREPTNQNLKRIIGERGNPQYPIYIISKGRSENCITADHLIKMEVPFNIVVEKDEMEAYAKHYGMGRIVELDMSFKGEYDTYIPGFEEDRSKGSGPARNFVWWHAKNVKKSKWHWIMDDNIYGFHYYYNAERVKASDGTLFASAEDFVNRYDNIAISGLNYYMFVIPPPAAAFKDRPYVPNTKIYSCLLINNDAEVRWAGRYNEDVDICIRSLKEGYSTIQFDAFLAKKGPTQTLGGGNTDAFYAEEGTLPKSNMLAWNHPDITEVIWRYSRWHHITNYDIFDYYKERSIMDTIQELARPQILNPDFAEDQLIIDEIKSIDFCNIKKWNILTGVPEKRREEILTVLKFYRFCKDTDRILSILTRPKVLDCDYTAYLWGSEVEDTPANKTMLDLLALGNENGVLTKSVNFDEYLSTVPEEQRGIIAQEMIRNKHLLKDYEVQTYNLKSFRITEEEHARHEDSKAYILNEYVKDGKNHEVPVTFFDKKIRKEAKVQNKKFQNNVATRGVAIEKLHEHHTIVVHGDELFDDDEMLCSELDKISTEEIINSVFYPVDLMAANYALDKKLKNNNFIPDDIIHGKAAYREIYKNMAEYADECYLFIGGKLTPDLDFLVEEFGKRNKKVQIFRNTQDTESIDEW